MATGTVERARQVGRRVGEQVEDAHDAGKDAARSEWVSRLAQFGYIVRGLVYGTLGLLAIQIALGGGDRETDQQGAIRALASQSFGGALLIVIAAGLAGYALWGFVRAVFDPLNKGTDLKGWAQRAAYLVSGLTHAGLSIGAIRLLRGAQREGSEQTVSFTASLLEKPFGAWLVGVVGLWVIGAGIGEFYLAATQNFKKDFELGKLSEGERKLATVLGRIGLAARGVVFSLTGLFVIQAGLTADAQRSRGLDGALEALAASPFGPALLGTVALGLIVFGVYSAFCARWMRLSSV